MSNEILIALAGLVLSALTYFAGVRRTEMRHARDDRERRVQRVFDRYMEFRRTSYTAGLDGAQKAGVASLESNAEIEQFCDLVVAHGEMHPLGSDHEQIFRGVDVLAVFQYAARERINFHRVSIQEVIANASQRT